MIKDVDGIVLSGMKYRETSKILRLFTRDYGILSVMAQGVYKKNSRLLSVTETFARCAYDLESGKNMMYLRSAELTDLHYGLRRSLELLKSAQSAAGLLLRALPEDAAQPALFDLYADLLALLPQSARPEHLTAAFYLQTASALGYQPYMYACTRCGNRKIKSLRFSIRERGILCENCSYVDMRSQSFSQGTYKVVHTMLFTPLREIDGGGGSGYEDEAIRIVRRYIQEVFDHRTA